MRALLPEDAAAARVLLLEQFGGTRYETRMLQLLELTGADGEHECAVVVHGDLTIGAVVVVRKVAGALGVESIVCLAGTEAPVLDQAVMWVLSRARMKSTRLVIAELPASPEFNASAHALERAGIHEEGEVSDFVSDGIGMRLLTFRLYEVDERAS